MTPASATVPLKGLFVAFEGGDGAGKSTQVRLLADALAAAGREVVVTRQPGGTPLGSAIRDLVLHGGHVSPRAEALLYAADKAHHVDELIRPTLERGVDVLTKGPAGTWVPRRSGTCSTGRSQGCSPT